MATDQLQRPEFYEGQYLGAADLDAAVTYARLGHARHSLGAHTWGIAVGLQLREEPSPAGGDAVDVFLQPGYAVDGFGRALVVPTPVQVPAELFRDELSGRVPVWLRYVEETAAGPGYGFEVCETDGTYARVVESYEVVVGDFASDEQRDEVSVAGLSADAIEALHTLDEDAPLQCDGSVPFQEFPDPREAHWLIPLGYVRWEAGPPSQLAASTEDDRRMSRAARRYLGVVAEGIHAADGVIRLRDRATDPPADGTPASSACAADVLRTDATDADLTYDEESEQVYPNELVWVEGDLRVTGDARLFGGKIEFRNADGGVDDTPLWVERNEANDLGGKDLRLLLGAGDGENRLVVGQLSIEADDTATVIDQVVMQDDGKVGIGITDQVEPLQVPLTIRASGEQEDVVDVQTSDGIPAWRISRLAEAGTEGLNIAEFEGDTTNTRLFIEAGGDVGIGTGDPMATLHVATGINASLSDTSGFLVLGDVEGHNLVFDDNEIIARNDGDTSALYLQANGGALHVHSRLSEEEEFIITNSGTVGIGTASPHATLHVATGSDATLSDDSGYLVIGNVNGRNLVADGNKILARDNGDLSTLHLQADGGTLRVHANKNDELEQVTITDAGQVGVGLSEPVARLHVRDSLNENAANLSAHVAVLENTSVGLSADVLALRIGASGPTSPTGSSNFVTFFGGDGIVGRIEGAAGGIAYRTGSGDFAECLPRLREKEDMEPGDIVGICAGKVSKATDSTHHVSVITGQPAVVGNMPSPSDAHLYEQVAFLGQVPVKVRGPVCAGALIVPSGRNDGTGIAVLPEDATSAQCAMAVGRAWESSDETGIKLINAAVGLNTSCLGLAALVQAQGKEIQALRTELDRIETVAHAANGIAHD